MLGKREDRPAAGTIIFISYLSFPLRAQHYQRSKPCWPRKSCRCRMQRREEFEQKLIPIEHNGVRGNPTQAALPHEASDFLTTRSRWSKSVAPYANAIVLHTPGRVLTNRSSNGRRVTSIVSISQSCPFLPTRMFSKVRSPCEAVGCE